MCLVRKYNMLFHKFAQRFKHAEISARIFDILWQIQFHNTPRTGRISYETKVVQRSKIFVATFDADRGRNNKIFLRFLKRKH